MAEEDDGFFDWLVEFYIRDMPPLDKERLRAAWLTRKAADD